MVVKIYPVKNRGKDFRSLSYHWAGERKQRMLRCEGKEDEKRARTLAREIATAIFNGRADHLTDTSKQLRVLKAAEDALSQYPISVDAACREYAQARSILGNRASLHHVVEFFARAQPAPLTSIEVPDAVEHFLVAQEKDGISLRHLQDTRSRLRTFARSFTGNIADITTAEMQSWLRDLKVAPRTRNNYRDRVVTFFRWAQNEGYLRRDLKTEAEGLKKLKTAFDIHIFSLEEAHTLMAGAIEHEPRAILYLALGMFAGLRPEEMQRLTDLNIRLDHNDIELKANQSKTGTRRLVPIQPNLRTWIEMFSPKTGKLVMRKTPLFVRRLARKLKVEWHHDIMRHSFISYAVALTQNVDQIALWSGNSRRVIYESYLNQVPEREGKLYFEIAPPKIANVIRLENAW